DYFVAVLSHEAVSNRGFRHTELREALKVADEFPEDWIFLIPTRLDDCRMPFQAMEVFNYVDLFPRWSDGVNEICRTLTYPAVSEKDLSKGNTLGLLTLGRAAEVKIPSKKRRQYRKARVSYVTPHYRVELVDLGQGIPTIGRVARGLNT